MHAAGFILGTQRREEQCRKVVAEYISGQESQSGASVAPTSNNTLKSPTLSTRATGTSSTESPAISAWTEPSGWRSLIEAA